MNSSEPNRMRVVGHFVEILALAAGLCLWFAPKRIAWPLSCAAFFALGLWAILYPPGILGWLKSRRREVDPFDESIWWLPRTIGVVFILSSIVLVIVGFSA